MQKLVFAVLISFAAMACTNSQAQKEQTRISATALEQIVDTAKDIQIVDVRTPGEFEKGHVKNAQNIDWNGNNFNEAVSKLDKSKKTYVYCLSGGRSGQAAQAMRDAGFTDLVEMPGGMMEWRSKGLPEETANSAKALSTEMSMDQYKAITTSDKIVLVDFYAEWCGPCKKMKPYLDKIAKDYSKTVEIVRIDADMHPTLLKALGVEGLPTLKMYKAGTEIWNHLGFIEEKDLRKQVKNAAK